MYRQRAAKLCAYDPLNRERNRMPPTDAFIFRAIEVIISLTVSGGIISFAALKPTAILIKVLRVLLREMFARNLSYRP